MGYSTGEGQREEVPNLTKHLKASDPTLECARVLFVDHDGTRKVVNNFINTILESKTTNPSVHTYQLEVLTGGFLVLVPFIIFM